MLELNDALDAESKDSIQQIADAADEQPILPGNY
jgi:hypothetical protein